MANIHIPWILLELEVERVYKTCQEVFNKTYQEVGKVTNNQDLGTTEVITLISGSGTFPIRQCPGPASYKLCEFRQIT